MPSGSIEWCKAIVEFDNQYVFDHFISILYKFHLINGKSFRNSVSLSWKEFLVI